MYWVCILYSESSDMFYKGQTSDLDNRLHRHNQGLEKYTKAGAPWKLLWAANKASRSETIKLESKLKNLSRIRLIKFMLKYKENVSSPDALLLIKQWSGC
ncbi:MAG: GIY-YIG nuclease family protein [Fulvivirga sp.]